MQTYTNRYKYTACSIHYFPDTNRYKPLSTGFVRYIIQQVRLLDRKVWFSCVKNCLMLPTPEYTDKRSGEPYRRVGNQKTNTVNNNNLIEQIHLFIINNIYNCFALK